MQVSICCLSCGDIIVFMQQWCYTLQECVLPAICFGFHTKQTQGLIVHSISVTCAILGSKCYPFVGTVLTCGKDNMLKAVDPQTYEVRQTFRAPQFSVGTIWCTACLSPDEQHVAAGSGNGSLYVWKVMAICFCELSCKLTLKFFLKVRKWIDQLSM